jgi:hypothetical protein
MDAALQSTPHCIKELLRQNSIKGSKDTAKREQLTTVIHAELF